MPILKSLVQGSFPTKLWQVVFYQKILNQALTPLIGFFFLKTFKQRTSIMSIFLWKIFCLIGGIGWEKVRRTFRRNSMAQIFSILWFITCVYYLGRVPSPIVTKKLKETSKTEEMEESEEETIWFHFVWCGFFGENSTGERLRIWRVQGTSF